MLLLLLIAAFAVTLAAATCNNDGVCDWQAGEDCVSCPADCAVQGGLCCGGPTGCGGSACASLSPCQQQQACNLFPPLGQSNCSDGNVCTTDQCTALGCLNTPLCPPVGFCYDVVCLVNATSGLPWCDRIFVFERCPPIGVADTPVMARGVPGQVFNLAANDDVSGAPSAFYWALDAPWQLQLLPGELLTVNRSGWLRYTPPPTFIGSRDFTYRIYPFDGSQPVSASTPVTIFVVDAVLSTTSATTTTANPSTYSTATPTTTPAPPPVVGACCNPYGTDVEGAPIVCADNVTLAVCMFTGGSWQGSLSQCSQVECATVSPNTTAPAWVPTANEMECVTPYPLCRPSLDTGCPYGYNDDWTCADPILPDCSFDAWRRRMAELWAIYYKGDTQVNMLFADMLGGQCQGREACDL